MSDFQAIADRVEIEALRGEFTDAAMTRDGDRLASLLTLEGVFRMPNIPVEFHSRDEVRVGRQRLVALWDSFVQTTHPGTMQLEGDTASAPQATARPQGWPPQRSHRREEEAHVCGPRNKPQATIRLLLDAMNSRYLELISQTVDDVFDPDVKPAHSI